MGKVLPTIESIAGSIDTALRTISRAPFGPDYQPDQPFDEAIADLSAAVAPLPAELRALSGDLGGIARSTRAMSGQLAVLVRDVDQLDRQLRQVSTLIDRYVASAVEARGLASTSRRDLASSARWTRFLMTALATLFALGQIVPIWLGLRLMGGPISLSLSDRRR